MEKSSEMERPYSYHTFLLPFEIEGKNSEKLNSEKIVTDVLNKIYWIEISDKGDKNASFKAVILKNNEIEREKETLQAIAYNQEQYFHENVKKAIHNYGGNNIVREFIFNFQNDNVDKLLINIVKENKDEDEKKTTYIRYTLNVSNIRLKVFNTGVCILILELNNSRHRNFESIKEINSLGRQISLPYIAEDSSKIACAKDITWEFLYNDNNTYSFKEKNEDFWKNPEGRENVYMLDLLDNMMIDKTKIEKYQIKPSIDDRMFTCCLIRDKDLSNTYKMDYINEEVNQTRKFKELSKSLYEYIYIDKEGDCSASTENFRKEILNNSIYHRWIEAGTIYGVSHTSFVAITSESDYSETIITRPFLTQYVEIAILVLAQRASILKFQKKIRGNLKNKEIQKIQSDYINYRNQLHFFEVSSQEQGIELYELIRKQLYIEREMEELEKNLKVLYEKSNIDNANMFNRFGLFIGVIAILSVVLDITSFIIMTEVEKNFYEQVCSLRCEIIGILIATVIISAIVWSLIKMKSKD